MSGVGVEFVGGPIDGEQRVVPCNAEMVPELPYYIVPECRPLRWDVETNAPLAESLVVQHQYRRELSQRDDGPLWLYRWVKP